jgi:hypothetical protein
MEPRLSPTPEDAERELRRVADRLRVAGPRLAARGTPPALQTLAQVREALQHLADVAAAAAGEPVQPVPVLGAHALADQVLVLGQELLAGPAAGTDVRRARAVKALTAIRDLL